MTPRVRAPKVKIKRYCAVHGCSNNNKTAPDTAFFSLPKDIDRRREWLVLIGREDLLRKRKISPKSYLVCAAHFEDLQMKTKVSKLLKEEAVPSKRLPHQPQEPSNSDSQRKATEDPIIIKSEPASPEIVDANAETPISSGGRSNQTTLKSEASDPCPLERVIVMPLSADKAVQTTISGEYKLKRKSEEDQEPEDSESKRRRKDQTYREMIIGKPKKEAPVPEEPEDDITRRFHKLIEWQNKIKNKFRGNRFDSEYKTFALNLHYSSPHAYRCLQSALRLPSRSTIVRLRHTVRPALDAQLLRSLAAKLRALPADGKYCSLCLDEMPLKRNLHYDAKADRVTGLQNIDGTVSPDLADRAHVVMAQGMYCEWRLPVAYALLAGADRHAELDAWLSALVRNLFAAGLEVRAVVSRQGSNFDRLSKAVKHVTVDRPYFFIDERKIYYILDAPHLLKCLLHDLLTSNFHHNGAVITFDYVRKLFEHQKEKNFRLIPKMTSAHVESNFQKMKVKHALQVFSNAMYAALDTYIDFQQVSDYARETAKFIKAVNDLFDVLNLSPAPAKGSKHGAGGGGLRMTEEQARVLAEGRETFAGLARADRRSGCDLPAQLDTFLNFQITIRSVTNLFEDLKTEGFEYLYTRNLNQDCLEEFFGDIRHQQSGGACAEPSPNQFTRAFSELFIGRMLKSSPADAREPDIYEILLKSEDLINNKIITPTADTRPSLVGHLSETDYRLEVPATRALTYVTSFLLFKCAEKHSCAEFAAALRMLPDLDQTDLSAHFVEYNKKASFYGKLKVPSRELHRYVEALEAAFAAGFERAPADRPGSAVYEVLRAVPPSKPCGCFPVSYLVKLFVRFRIFHTLKQNNLNVKTANKSTAVRFTVQRLE